MLLYTFPYSCAFASHLALECAGADYEITRVDFGPTRRSKDSGYHKINPKGRVPALVTEDGILTETPAILVYIAQQHPEANLLPADPWQFAQLQSFNSYLCSTVHVAHAHKYRGYRWADEQSSYDDMQKKVPQTMTECFSLIEESLLKAPWVMGEQFTIADLYLFTMTRWLEGDGVDVSKLPGVMEHMQRMLALDFVQRVIEMEQARPGISVQ